MDITANTIDNCNDTIIYANNECNYIGSFFENIFPIKKAKLGQPKRWSIMRSLAIILYAGLLLIYFSIIYLFPNIIGDTKNYTFAAPILASVIFWPFIVIYDCELFYKLFLDLRPLLKNKHNCDIWYKRNAIGNFSILSSSNVKDIIIIIINIIMIFMSIVLFAINLNSSLTSFMHLNFIAFLIPLCISSLITCLSDKNKNMNIILLVTNCGLTYYAYIMQHAKETLPYFIKPEYIFGNVCILIAVVIVFFISGATICPMLGLFKAFYFSDFEDFFTYPIESIACSLNKINKIKKYFLHLTFITLLAYFQLFGSVYFLGIMEKNSFVTEILFMLGSMFPLVMYLSTNVFFKKLCHKIYSLQVENLDLLISAEMNKDTINPDNLQAFVSVKEMYAEEFEIHAEMSKEILIAMCSPLLTTIVAVIFPFAR